MNFEAIERELKARWERPYNWHGRRQNNADDRRTNFIYSIPTWAGLKARLAEWQGTPENEFLFDYAANRWYNFWSAQALEAVFAASPCIKPNPDRYDKTVDFWLNDLPFDHKTSAFPRSNKYPGGLQAARRDPASLIRCLYTQQSGEGRFHRGNRLFVVLHDRRGEHWKLKAEIGLLREAIAGFLAAPEILQVSPLPGLTVSAGLILVTR